MTKTLTEQIVHIQNDLDVVFAEVVRLEKQLAIATKALEEFKKTEDNYLDFGLTSSWKEVKLNPNRVATKALKEMKGVK